MYKVINSGKNIVFVIIFILCISVITFFVCVEWRWENVSALGDSSELVFSEVFGTI